MVHPGALSSIRMELHSPCLDHQLHDQSYKIVAKLSEGGSSGSVFEGRVPRDVSGVRFSSGQSDVAAWFQLEQDPPDDWATCAKITF